MVVISESHLAIHIWPENRYAAVDIFTCGETVRIDLASALLRRAFRAGRAVERSFTRGDKLTVPHRRERGAERSGREVCAATADS